jgi:hypothetical protein
MRTGIRLLLKNKIHLKIFGLSAMRFCLAAELLFLKTKATSISKNPIYLTLINKLMRVVASHLANIEYQFPSLLFSKMRYFFANLLEIAGGKMSAKFYPKAFYMNPAIIFRLQNNFPKTRFPESRKSSSVI